MPEAQDMLDKWEFWRSIPLLGTHEQSSKPLLVDKFYGIILPNMLGMNHNDPIEESL